MTKYNKLKVTQCFIFVGGNMEIYLRAKNCCVNLNTGEVFKDSVMILNANVVPMPKILDVINKELV